MIQHTQIEAGGLQFTFSIEPSHGAQLDIELRAEPAADLPDTYLVRFFAICRRGGKKRERWWSI
jgi:hypothetical protein